MTLPTNPDTDIYLDRPNDEIFAKIKQHFPYITERSQELKEMIIKVALDDLVLDHALSNALDDIGKVIEYQAQNEGIEKPKFNGLSILKDAERVGKLNFILGLCQVVGLSEETTEAVREAEISRLWGEGVHREKKDGAQILKLPDEVASLLRDLTRTLTKKGANGTAREPRNTTNRPTQPFQRRTNPNPKTPSGSKT